MSNQVNDRVQIIKEGFPGYNVGDKGTVVKAVGELINDVDYDKNQGNPVPTPVEYLEKIEN